MSKQSLSILIHGTSGLQDTLSPSPGSGTITHGGLRELITAAHPNLDLNITFHGGTGSEGFRRELESSASDVLTSRPDLVILSVDEDLAASETSPVPAIDLFDNLVAIVNSIKGKIGAHVIVLNVTTAEPGPIISDYSKESAEPRSLAAQRYNLVAMRLSFETGISVIDVDRIIAEMGANEHANPFLAYSAEARRQISSELYDVMTEYGFFDERALLPQVGRTSE